MDWLLKGIFFGAGISLLLGPIFIIMVHIGIAKGYKYGLFFGLGTWVSDLILMSSCFVFISKLEVYLKEPLVLKSIGIIGSILLFAIAFISIRSTVDKWNRIDEAQFDRSNANKLFTQGFLINSLNPSALVFWMGVSSYIIQAQVSSKLLFSQIGFFYVGIQGTIIFLDITKIYLGHQFQNWLDPKYLIKMQKIVGYILMLFGVILLFKSLFLGFN